MSLVFADFFRQCMGCFFCSIAQSEQQTTSK